MRNYEIILTGLNHLEKGTPCQDWYALAENGALASLLTVSDGVSSCPCAQEAAQAVSESAAEAMKSAVLIDASVGGAQIEQLMRHAFISALTAIRRLAKRSGRPAAWYGTTLALCHFDKQSGDAFWGNVGDSGVLALRKDGEVLLLCEPQKGSRPSSTFPLLSVAHWKFGRAANIAAVAVATDGVLDRLTKTGDDGTRVPSEAARALFEIVASHETASGAAVLDECLEGEGKGPFRNIRDDKTLLISANEEACARALGIMRPITAEGREGSDHELRNS